MAVGNARQGVPRPHPQSGEDHEPSKHACCHLGVVGGVINHIGRYTVDEKDKSFTFHVEASTYPNWDGTAQKRPFTVSGDELKYTNAAASGGGRADLVWKRVK